MHVTVLCTRVAMVMPSLNDRHLIFQYLCLHIRNTNLGLFDVYKDSGMGFYRLLKAGKGRKYILSVQQDDEHPGAIFR